MRILAISVFLMMAVGLSPAISQSAPSRKPLPCVDVQIGDVSALALNCLNQAFRNQVEHQQAATGPQAPIDARSPSNQVGTFNNNAAQEQMGNAYGVSSIPQRPKSVFINPLIPPTPH
jgi:hypothetical protein